MSVPTPLDALIQARALVAGPYAWFKGYWFGSREKAQFGMCWCALGAVRHIYDMDGTAPYTDEGFTAYLLAEEALNQSVPLSEGYREIVAYNDKKTTKKKDILAVFDNAIAHLQKENS